MTWLPCTKKGTSDLLPYFHHFLFSVHQEMQLWIKWVPSPSAVPNKGNELRHSFWDHRAHRNPQLDSLGFSPDSFANSQNLFRFYSDYRLNTKKVLSGLYSLFFSREQSTAEPLNCRLPSRGLAISRTYGELSPTPLLLTTIANNESEQLKQQSINMSIITVPIQNWWNGL